jgi:hypothetical protein
LDVVLVSPSALANRQAVVRAMKKIGKVQVAFEGAFIICKAGNPVKAASRLTDISEIDDVAIARKVSSRFPDVTNAIVGAGIKAILPKERFYVKVIQTASADYVDRDVEFASTAALVGKLAEIGSLPARNEHEGDRVILAIVGKRSAYVCVKGTT